MQSGLAADNPAGPSSDGAPGLPDRANDNPPHWAHDKIDAWDEAEFHRLEPFIEHTYWCGQDSINVHRVVGTQHPDYQGKTWLELLNGGKRMDINLPLYHSNPDYYLQTKQKKPMMHYVSLDGLRYYVSIDGNHRTCIAKFDFHYTGRSMLHGVTVVRHVVDWEFYRRSQALIRIVRALQLPLHIVGRNDHVSRDDTSGWKLDHYRPYLAIEDYLEGTVTTLDRGATGKMLSELRVKVERRGARPRVRWPWRRR